MGQLVFCDLEFNCGNNTLEIIQIGAVKVDDQFEEVGRFNAFVKPLLNPVLTPFCKKLTGISQQSIDEASSFLSVMNDFYAWICNVEDSTLVFWGHDDSKELAREFRRNNSESNLKTYNFQGHIKRQVKSQLGLKTALNLFGVEFEGTQHDALVDAINLRSLYVKVLTSPEILLELNLEVSVSKLMTQLHDLLDHFSLQSHFVFSTDGLLALQKECQILLSENKRFSVEERELKLKQLYNNVMATKKDLEKPLLISFEHDFDKVDTVCLSKRYKPFAKNYKGQYNLNFSKLRHRYVEVLKKGQWYSGKKAISSQEGTSRA